jgi:hypothetical protein
MKMKPKSPLEGNSYTSGEVCTGAMKVWKGLQTLLTAGLLSFVRFVF